MIGCAENVTGLKQCTEDAGVLLFRLKYAVGERFICAEAVSVRNGGVYRSENVGMSNHPLRMRNPHAENSRFPWQWQSPTG
jgi:hypothetical protein